MAIKRTARKLIENPDDPDSPESFGVAKHFDSPVARIAATNGFKRHLVSNEERWVKELSNGKEVWLRTIASRDFEIPMDFKTGTGGREWELVEYTKINDRYTNPKQLIRTNEVAMTYVLGAYLQRLATWPANVPKPTLENIPVPDPDDPEAVLRQAVKAETEMAFSPELAETIWSRLFATRWPSLPYSPEAFAAVISQLKEPQRQTLWLVYTHNMSGLKAKKHTGCRISDVENKFVDIAYRLIPNAGLQEDVTVPDPDDPALAITSFVKSKTPYYPDYAKLANYIANNRETVYINGTVTRHGRYVHENSTTFELNIESNDLPDEIAVLANVVEKMIGEEIVRINKKIYRALEREWDSRNTDEYIDEWLGEQTDDRYNALGHTWDVDEDTDEEALTYAQLDDSAKATARDIHRNSYQYDEWWDHIYEEWKTELEEMGFGNPDISFSGFASQGDGASFTANSFDFMKWVEWFTSNKPVERGHPYTDDLPVTESVDEPSKEQLIHMGRAGKCDQHCQHCGAYCTLIHYDLNGTQMPQYHICRQCDAASADTEDDDARIAAAGLRRMAHHQVQEDGPDDPTTFMQSLEKLPDHEMIDTSNPAPSYSRSYNCACGRWSFGGLSRTPEETAAFEKQAKEEFDKHAQMSSLARHDDLDKLQARNWVTARRLKEGYNFPDQGEQDKPEHWADDPEPDVDDPNAVLKQEVAKRSEPIKKLHIHGRRWYRRGAGGVYCKAYIYINDKLVHVTPEQYGYGEHYLTLATDWLRRSGYLDGLLAENEPIWYLRDKKIIPDLMYYVTDVKRERDL